LEQLQRAAQVKSQLDGLDASVNMAPMNRRSEMANMRNGMEVRVSRSAASAPDRTAI
jgi:hypothetical protein